MPWRLDEHQVVLEMKDPEAEATRLSVRPQVVREIALWWQSELDRAADANQTPDLPSYQEVMGRFRCSQEEALRGLGLGEQRHFSGIE